MRKTPISKLSAAPTFGTRRLRWTWAFALMGLHAIVTSAFGPTIVTSDRKLSTARLETCIGSVNHLDAIREDGLKNQFFALRHGQSLANVAGLIASDPSIACEQYGLSETGMLQAQAAGEQLVNDFLTASTNPTGIAIVSSDLLRAKETAELVKTAIVQHNAKAGSTPIALYEECVVMDTRLRERGFGNWDGGSDVHYKDVWKDDAMDPFHTRMGVESVWSVTERATNCVHDWNARLQDHWIVCVAHGDVLQILQTGFSSTLDPSQHRSMEHLETATLRALELK